jgi:hypothetical protein
VDNITGTGGQLERNTQLLVCSTKRALILTGTEAFMEDLRLGAFQSKTQYFLTCVRVEFENAIFGIRRE